MKKLSRQKALENLFVAAKGLRMWEKNMKGTHADEVKVGTVTLANVLAALQDVEESVVTPKYDFTKPNRMCIVCGGDGHGRVHDQPCESCQGLGWISMIIP